MVELLRRCGEPTSLRIGIANAPAAKLLTQDCVFGDQVICNELVIASHPAGDGEKKLASAKPQQTRGQLARAGVFCAARAF